MAIVSMAHLVEGHCHQQLAVLALLDQLLVGEALEARVRRAAQQRVEHELPPPRVVGHHEEHQRHHATEPQVGREASQLRAVPVGLHVGAVGGATPQ